MIVLQTIAVAFAMFSAIPVPQFDWNETNMRYAMCAFPLIGAVIGDVYKRQGKGRGVLLYLCRNAVRTAGCRGGACAFQPGTGCGFAGKYRWAVSARRLPGAVRQNSCLLYTSAALCGAAHEVCAALMDAATTDACLDILDGAQPVSYTHLAVAGFVGVEHAAVGVKLGGIHTIRQSGGLSGF